MIISSHLSPGQENQLVCTLSWHKGAIGWSITDLKGINPSTCLHRIHLEENVKPTRKTQCKLNTHMEKVVKKGTLKLLYVRIIYPISDSRWVSPVPKKFGIIMVRNNAKELVPH